MRRALDALIITLLATAVALGVLEAVSRVAAVGVGEMWGLTAEYLGPWRWLFAPLVALMLWLVGEWMADRAGILASHNPDRAARLAAWISEAGPLAGLLGTVIAVLQALAGLGPSGLADPVSRAAFLVAFGRAMATTALGAALALTSLVLVLLMRR